ncbi:MAG TPA: M28 family peptidase [Gemmatimonadaceae bacterium]|nr:M28 family peptidase [Gemmatimonadaceae bacterium]
MTRPLFLIALTVTAAACARGGSAGAAAPATLAPAPSAASVDARIGLQRDPELARLLADISPARIAATDSALVSFGTRHAMSDTVSDTRGVGAARRWIFTTLSSYSRDCGGCLRVEYDPAMVVVQRHPQKPTVPIVNVLAWLPGRDTSRVVVIGGHYDSCICSIDPFDVTSDAPGADDDGSGSSAVIELARVFSRHYPKGLDATVIFALYSGEEEGLLGSTHLAQRLHEQGYRVAAGMTDDIVGNVIADDGRVDSTSVRIYSGDPDNGPGRELARYAWGAGLVYQPAFEVRPTFRLDRIHRGGDHIPFWRAGDAALRFSERLENYKRQHLPTDTIGAVRFGYVARVARLNAAVVGSLAAAPAVPDSVTARRDAASGGQHWLLRWKPSPGATAYEVLVRRTTSPTWERVIPVGSDTTYLLADQLDDLWAGVRAVGADGHRSLAAAVPPPAFVTR